MQKRSLTILLTIVLIVGGAIASRHFFDSERSAPQQSSITISETQLISMHITSSVFTHNESIPRKYTCDGDGINPPLLFSDVPEDTQSLALIMEDPDVPKSVRPDGMWDHWVVWNMPPNATGIPENSVPPGITGVNTGGEVAYQGPCPPDREHRYFFKLFALDTMLDLGMGAAKAELERAMEGHVIEKAELIGRYNRQ